jgi:hypothetical protein
VFEHLGACAAVAAPRGRSNCGVGGCLGFATQVHVHVGWGEVTRRCGQATVAAHQRAVAAGGYEQWQQAVASAAAAHAPERGRRETDEWALLNLKFK